MNIFLAVFFFCLWYLFWDNAEKVTKIIPWPAACVVHIVLAVQWVGYLCLSLGIK